MSRVVFLLEEPSMKVFLLEYLPRLVPGWVHGEHFLLVPHEGKSDLDRSFPKKLANWREPGVRFVIVRDNDNANCLELKSHLLKCCIPYGHQVAVRLICQELEAWYLGDMDALARTYPKDRKAIQRLLKRFPDPDACHKPSHELERNIPAFQKRDAARRLGQLLSHTTNRSTSLCVFSRGVTSFLQIKLDFDV